MPPEWFEKNKTAFFAVLVLAILGLEIAQLVSGRTTSPAYVGVPSSVSPTPPKVYVSGAVNSPGVYPFSPGDRVEQAVALAGGAGPDADLTRVNLAAVLADEQHVHVPAAGETQSAPAQIDINTADAAELQTLPGIGEVTAQKIIAYRRLNGPFRSPDGLLAAGLTRSQVEKIKDLVLFR